MADALVGQLPILVGNFGGTLGRFDTRQIVFVDKYFCTRKHASDIAYRGHR
jgi:hypothetical protein